MNLFFPLQKLHYIADCTCTFAIPYHQAVVRIFDHRNILGGIKSSTSSARWHLNIMRRPCAYIIAAFRARAENPHIRITLVEKKGLDRLIRAISIAHENLVRAGDNVPQTFSNLLVKPP